MRFRVPLLAMMIAGCAARVADLFEAASPENFPGPARRNTMRWLVRWLDSHGMEQATVISAHNGASQPWMLERLREMNAVALQ